MDSLPPSPKRPGKRPGAPVSGSAGDQPPAKKSRQKKTATTDSPLTHRSSKRTSVRATTTARPVGKPDTIDIVSVQEQDLIEWLRTYFAEGRPHDINQLLTRLKFWQPGINHSQIFFRLMSTLEENHLIGKAALEKLVTGECLRKVIETHFNQPLPDIEQLLTWLNQSGFKPRAYLRQELWTEKSILELSPRVRSNLAAWDGREGDELIEQALAGDAQATKWLKLLSMCSDKASLYYFQFRLIQGCTIAELQKEILEVPLVLPAEVDAGALNEIFMHLLTYLPETPEVHRALMMAASPACFASLDVTDYAGLFEDYLAIQVENGKSYADALVELQAEVPYLLIAGSASQGRSERSGRRQRAATSGSTADRPATRASTTARPLSRPDTIDIVSAQEQDLIEWLRTYFAEGRPHDINQLLTRLKFWQPGINHSQIFFRLMSTLEENHLIEKAALEKLVTDECLRKVIETHFNQLLPDTEQLLTWLNQSGFKPRAYLRQELWTEKSILELSPRVRSNLAAWDGREGDELIEQALAGDAQATKWLKLLSMCSDKASLYYFQFRLIQGCTIAELQKEILEVPLVLPAEVDAGSLNEIFMHLLTYLPETPEVHRALMMAASPACFASLDVTDYAGLFEDYLAMQVENGKSYEDALVELQAEVPYLLTPGSVPQEPSVSNRRSGRQRASGRRTEVPMGSRPGVSGSILSTAERSMQLIAGLLPSGSQPAAYHPGLDNPPGALVEFKGKPFETLKKEFEEAEGNQEQRDKIIAYWLWQRIAKETFSTRNKYTMFFSGMKRHWGFVEGNIYLNPEKVCALIDTYIAHEMDRSQVLDIMPGEIVGRKGQDPGFLREYVLNYRALGKALSHVLTVLNKSELPPPEGFKNWTTKALHRAVPELGEAYNKMTAEELSRLEIMAVATDSQGSFTASEHLKAMAAQGHQAALKTFIMVMFKRNCGVKRVINTLNKELPGAIPGEAICTTKSLALFMKDDLENQEPDSPEMLLDGVIHLRCVNKDLTALKRLLSKRLLEEKQNFYTLKLSLTAAKIPCPYGDGWGSKSIATTIKSLFPDYQTSLKSAFSDSLARLYRDVDDTQINYCPNWWELLIRANLGEQAAIETYFAKHRELRIDPNSVVRYLNKSSSIPPPEGCSVWSPKEVHERIVAAKKPGRRS